MTVTVSLSAELEDFVEKKVASGEFASPGDVLAAALTLLQERDNLDAFSTEALKLAWKVLRAEISDRLTCPH